MDSQPLNNSDGHLPLGNGAANDSNHGRFPQHSTPSEATEYREVNLDQLTVSDFGVRDSGLPYSDHDYIGSNPNVRCSPETCHFPVLSGLSDQFLNGETVDLTVDRADNRAVHVPSTLTVTAGSAVRKPQLQGPTMFRSATAKGEDIAGPSQSPVTKPATWHPGKPIVNVTQPKKSGRPPKNEPRELSGGNRLIGRAMVKAGMEPQQSQMQGQFHHAQAQMIHPIHEMGMIRGAAPIVTPARGQKIQPRGRSAAGARREIHDDGNGGYGMSPMHHVASQGAYRSISASSPRKPVVFRSAQAAEDAHSREMMEAAQNALAPSNATISGQNLVLPAQNPQLHPILPVQHQQAHHHQLQQQHHTDDGDFPRTPGRGMVLSPMATSPLLSGDRRTISESQEMAMLRQEPPRIRSDGLPMTPGAARKMPARSPRSRMSTSESNTSSGHVSPQRPYTSVMSPRHQPALPSRAVHGSPHRPMLTGAQLKSPPAGPMLSLSSGPSTMASVQMQMTSNVSIPSHHHPTYQQPPASRPVAPSVAGRAYYDIPGAQAAPLITATGSNTYTPRRRKEKESDEAVEAEVTRNVKNIMLADKTQRISTTSSHTLSPRQDATSDEESPRGRHVQPVAEPKRGGSRGSPLKGKRAGKQKGKDEEDEKQSEGNDNWIVECICGESEDDGEPMVGCDTCIRWQHVDCIFPRTKKAPEGSYICTTCDPRQTDLTPEQARAYQDRRKEQQIKEKDDETRKKLAERKKRKEEDMRRSVTSSSRTHSKGGGSRWNDAPSSSATVPFIPPSFKQIEKNEYSNNARRFLTISRSPTTPSASAEILKKLRETPRIRQIIVTNKQYGVLSTMAIDEGSYVSELCGHVILQKEAHNREIAPGALNDLTFLFEKDGDNIIIDARKCGNTARFVRRSCNPNAQLREIMSGTELHIMLAATRSMDNMEEVTIPFEADWKKHPRPIQGCACGKESECAIEAFYNAQSTKMQNLQNVASSSRRSLPANGTTPKGARSPRRAGPEKKKGGSVKKAITKKGKKKGIIKLPRHIRKSKGGSTSTGESEGEEETEKEYEESTADEKEEMEKEVKEDKSTRGRRRKDTASTSEGEKEMPILQPIRSSARIRTDSEVKKEEVDEKEDKASSSTVGAVSSPRRGRKSAVEKEEEIKKEEEEVKKGEEDVSIPPPKKEEKPKKKPWPEMNYSLPSERNKMTREERKLQATLAQIEKDKKKGAGSTPGNRGSSTRGRKPSASVAAASTTPIVPPKEERPVSTGRGKRKADAEDAAGKADTQTAAASTPLVVPPKKRLTVQEETKKKEETHSSSSVPTPHLPSPLKDESINAAPSPAPPGGKKKWLQRHREDERLAAEAAAAKLSVLATTTTPSRSKRTASRRESEAVGGMMMMMGGVKGKRGIRQEMKMNAINVREKMTTTAFTIGKMEGSTVPSISYAPSTSRLPPPTPVVPPSEPAAPLEKKKLSLEEYRARKKDSGVMTAKGEKKDESEKTETVKKSFMPSVGDSFASTSSSLAHVDLPAMGMDELSERVYGTKKASTSSTTVGMRTPEVGKTEPAPKRQSINDRLRNEFSLPSLKSAIAAPRSVATSAASPAAASAASSTASISMSSSTPSSGWSHKGRLSDATRAVDVDVGPPALIECPRLASSDPPSSASSTPRQSTSAIQFHQRAAAIRSTSK